MGEQTILIVDDDADIRTALTDLLQDEGFAVSSVANGRDALAFLKQRPATSMVLLDLMMPVMDGFKFRVEQLRDPQLAAIPVVVMTARGPMDAGAIDVENILPKPLKVETLLETISRVARAG